MSAAKYSLNNWVVGTIKEVKSYLPNNKWATAVFVMFGIPIRGMFPYETFSLAS